MSAFKDVGKLAYDTYCSAVDWKSVRGDDLPKWEDQSERLQTAWNKAALAVAMATMAENRGEPSRATQGQTVNVIFPDSSPYYYLDGKIGIISDDPAGPEAMKKMPELEAKTLAEWESLARLKVKP